MIVGCSALEVGAPGAYASIGSMPADAVGGGRRAAAAKCGNLIPYPPLRLQKPLLRRPGPVADLAALVAPALPAGIHLRSHIGLWRPGRWV